MRSGQRQAVQAYQRVRDFIASHALTPPATYGPGKDMLAQAIARLNAHAGEQEVGTRLTRATTRTQRTWRERVAACLRPMVKVSRVTLRGAPGTDRALTMPTTTTTMSLLTSAKAFREIGATYESVFVKHGLPSDFLAKLDSAIAALSDAQAQSEANVRRHVGARAGIAQEIRRGRDAVELLDAVVVSSFAGNDEVLAAWRNAKKLKYTSRVGTPAATPSEIAA